MPFKELTIYYDDPQRNAKAQPLLDPLKCLKHNLRPTSRFCALCEAKIEAGGKTEYAKRLFVSREMEE